MCSAYFDSDLISFSGRAADRDLVQWPLAFRDAHGGNGNPLAHLSQLQQLQSLHPFLPLGVHGHPPRLTDARSCSLAIHIPSRSI
jgi:hypothetical protein